MHKGMYIALSGAVLKRTSLDLFAQNVANANTSGYKRQRISFKDHIIPVDNKPPGFVDGRVMANLSNITIDFSKGSYSKTGNPLDIAINGEGFFAIEGDKYTRSGNFSISSDGYLVDQSGIKVLGNEGPIEVQGSNLQVKPSGEVIVDDISVGTLKIVDFPDKGALKKLSANMFTADVEGEAVDSQVLQGHLEDSNVNVIQEMVQLLESHREFESYQKMIHAFDEATSKTINEMGR